MPGTLRFFNPLHRNCHPRATKHVTKESRANHFESTRSQLRAGESKNLPILAHTLYYLEFKNKIPRQNRRALRDYCSRLLPRVSPIGYDMRR
jgi:hypothetical protein